MTKRTRILLLALGIVTLAAAVWITVNIRNGRITSGDDSVDVELIAPSGQSRPATEAAPPR
jgi:hypothetical protein